MAGPFPPPVRISGPRAVPCLLAPSDPPQHTHSPHVTAPEPDAAMPPEGSVSPEPIRAPRERPARVRISIVVPIFNEVESLELLHAEIQAAMEEFGEEWEVVYVDDCSTDGSFGVLKELWESDTHVRLVKFRTNCGQTAAMAAGFDTARGELVATMDGDLQNDPGDIPRMVHMIEQGYDIVAGWRRNREDGFILRRVPSMAANRIIGWLTGVKIHDTGCTLKLFRAKVVRSMSIYADQHRFLPVLSASSGARITETVVNHRARQFGTSKYGLSRATRVMLDILSVKLIAQFSQRPLHYFGLISLSFLGFTTFFALLGLVSLDGSSGPGSRSLVQAVTGDFRIHPLEMIAVGIVIILMMTVVFFAMLGLLGELAVKASGIHRRGTLSRILNELH